MIHELDETLRGIVKKEVIRNTDIEVVFDAPTKDWASRRNTPTIDIYLYDIREDLRRRTYGEVDIKDDSGRTVRRGRVPKVFKLSYLVTAWTQRPEDEHRLLSAMLAAFLHRERIPVEELTGSLADQGWPIDCTIALPPPEDRALSDVWSALGGELKPSLDLVCITPMDIGRMAEVSSWVTEKPRFTVHAPNGSEDVPGSGGAPGGRPVRRQRPEPAGAGVMTRGGQRVIVTKPAAPPLGDNGNGDGNGEVDEQVAAAAAQVDEAIAALAPDIVREEPAYAALFQDDVATALEDPPQEESLRMMADEEDPGRIFNMRGRRRPPQ